MSSPGKAVVLFNKFKSCFVVPGKRCTSSSNMNPLQVLGPRWFSILRFLPKWCLFTFCRPSLASGVLLWTPTTCISSLADLQLCATAARTRQLRLALYEEESKVSKLARKLSSYSPVLFYKTHLNRLVRLFYLSSPFQIVESWRGLMFRGFSSVDVSVWLRTERTSPNLYIHCVKSDVINYVTIWESPSTSRLLISIFV